MAKTSVLQTDFLAGEISPRMEMQDNVEGRKHGVELMLNWLLHPQGSAETAPGTKWVADINETSARIFHLRFFPTQIAVIVIGISNVYVFYPDIPTPIATFSSPITTTTGLRYLQAVPMPDKAALVFTSTDHLPSELEYDSLTNVWSLSLMPLVNTPSRWAVNSPIALGFYGGRMWLGGGGDDFSAFWGSKSGNYYDFDLGGALADDAIESRLDRQGAICWITGGQGLLIGTENAEHVISASEGLIIPGDIQSKIQSTFGSMAAQALEVGNEIMYLSPEGRKIRSISYEWSKDAWRSRDLTYAGEHITGGGNSLKRIVYAANPDSLIVGVTELGNLILATYEPSTQTIGFARRTTQGGIIDAMAREKGGYDEIWILVDRGTGLLHLEKTTFEENINLDSFAQFTSATPISGGTAPHLAGKTCQVTVDGAVHPDVIPGVGGVFTIEYSGYEINIGLYIPNKIVSLPVEGSLSNIGSTRPMRKRLVDIAVKVLDSWRPKINGQRTPDRRVPTPMGEVEPARTEVVRVGESGWGDEVRVTIEQDLPLRTEISGWFGQIIREKI